jgi:hypothetical protein
MEPLTSLPYSKEPAFGPYLGPDEPTPHHPLYFLGPSYSSV